MAVDVLRIDVDDWTDGEVTAAFRQPLNLTGGYANNTIDPYRVYADGVHTYVTTFGNFTATATAPHVLSAYDLDDRLMATGSAVRRCRDVSVRLSVEFDARRELEQRGNELPVRRPHDDR